jgi:putative phosphoesterase
MRIGILSDSHDDMAAIGRAVELFNAEEVAQVVHAGDIVSPFTFEVLRNLRAPLAGIFGNNDGDRLLLRERSGGVIHPQPYLTLIGECKVVVVHEPHLVKALADSNDFDLVIYGHTHIPEVRRVGRTLVVNPGKTARLHKGISTAAIVDLDALEARIVEL